MYEKNHLRILISLFNSITKGIRIQQFVVYLLGTKMELLLARLLSRKAAGGHSFHGPLIESDFN